ncbi:MAG: hypothetical protein LBH82_01600 [Bacteroidales bacterium]|jgi:hypothetical protein|nr:hypothetical protein [Bacteroidales bacterium]
MTKEKATQTKHLDLLKRRKSMQKAAYKASECGKIFFQFYLHISKKGVNTHTHTHTHTHTQLARNVYFFSYKTQDLFFFFIEKVFWSVCFKNMTPLCTYIYGTQAQNENTIKNIIKN